MIGSLERALLVVAGLVLLIVVVIASLVLQGWTIPWLARRLDLEDQREVAGSESLERRS